MKSLLFFLFMGISTAFSQEFIGEVFPVDSLGKYALFNDKGEQQSDWVRYDKVQSTAGIKYFKVQKFGRWGLADQKLRQELRCDFQSIYQNTGLIFAEKPSELYILNQKLDTLKIIPDFNRISFSAGYEKEWSRYKSTISSEFRMIIHTLNGSGIMNKKLEWVCEPIYDDIFWMHNIAFIRKGDKVGFLSVENTLIEPAYKALGFFNKDVLEFKDFSGHRSYYLKDGRLIPDSDSTLVYDLSYATYKIYKNGKGELYDKSLNKLITHSHEDAYQINSFYKKHGSSLSEFNLESFEKEFAFLSQQKVGVISENGRQIIPAEYQHVDAAFEGFYIVQTIEDSLFGVINSSNNYVITPKFTFIDFYGTYFRVIDENKKGILNESGDTLVPIEFDEINFEKEGFLTKKNSRKGFYTHGGKLILNTNYSAVFRSTGGLEFRSQKGDCMVNKNGLLTMRYCKHVSRTDEKVKYYYGGKIVIKEITNEVAGDSTIYAAPKSIYVEDRWRNSNQISTHHDSFITFQNQLNGKYGSKAKKRTDWGIPAAYDNIHSVDYNFRVKKLHQESFNFAGQYFTTKERVAPFYGNNGSREQFLLSYEGKGNSRTWHASVFDVTVNMDQEVEYYSPNHYVRGPQPLILKRFGFNAVSLTSGDFSLEKGQRIMTYKDIFEDLNECHNFEIVNKYQFGKMSQNPMITVLDANWKVLMIEENQTYNEVGEYSEYRELASGAALIKRPEGKYNILVAGKTELIKDDAEDIKVVMQDEFEYYFVQKLYSTAVGTTAIGWSLYNTSGQIIDGFYDQIEIIDYNHFRVKKDNKVMWMNNKGSILKSLTLD